MVHVPDIRYTGRRERVSLLLGPDVERNAAGGRDETCQSTVKVAKTGKRGEGDDVGR